jgi:hypothetical protein
LQAVSVPLSFAGGAAFVGAAPDVAASEPRGGVDTGPLAAAELTGGVARPEDDGGARRTQSAVATHGTSAMSATAGRRRAATIGFMFAGRRAAVYHEHVKAPSVSLRIAWVMVGLLTLAFAPYLAWRVVPSRTLEVVIVDKTVPFHNYREHTAVPWLLHTMKIKNAAGRFLDPARDYIGFDPAAKKGHDLTDENLASADVLVVTDTYGVYVGDYERPGEQAALERSPKIYGGFSDDEARVIEAFAARGGMVLGEFNTFASPTTEAARARLEAIFGVRWTGWVARYWPDLQDRNEVPQWIGRVYERVTGHRFEMRGGGLVVVRADSDIVVLRDDEDLRAGIVSQTRTSGGAAFDFPERGAFSYWMDIVDATASEVLYDHVVEATPAGEQKLVAHGLSRRFPAVTRRWEAWYFAGDFVDNAIDLGSPERAWVLPMRRAMVGCGAAGDESFFWGWYAPIVSRLLASRAR